MLSLIRRYTQYYNRQLLLCSSLLTISSMNFAFDNQGFSQTQALATFTKQFGWCNAKGKCVLEAWWLSLFNSIIFIGFGFGIIIGSQVNKRYGRRMTVSCMSAWAICCAIINITATSRWQIFAGRILNYIYVGMEFSSIPVFQAELVPAPVRGLAVASYQLSVGVGGLIMSLVIRGTSTIPGSASYRIPYGLMFVTPSIVGPLVWLLPESPRFLLSKGRDEEARRALSRVRVDATADSVDDEVQQIQLSLAAEKERGSFKDCFQGTNLRRTLIVMGTNTFMQLTGQPFWTQYGTLFVASLDVMNPFTYTAIFHSVNIVANLLALLLVDRIGRRPILVIMSSLQALFLFVMGGMGLPAKPTLEAGKVIVGSVIMCGFFWNLGYAALTYLIMAEIPSQKVRDSTVRIGGICQVLATFVSAFTVPYLLDAPYADLGSKVGFIYGVFSALAAGYAFLFIPELKNRSFEEVDILFHDKVRAIGSSRWKPATSVMQELSEMAHEGEQGDIAAEKKEEMNNLEQA